MEKKNNEGGMSFFKKIETSFQSKGFRSGAYATVVTALVIVAVIIVNLIVSAVDLRKDVTTNKLNSLADGTLELLSGIDDEITIYYLTENNQVVSMFQVIFEQYEKHGKNITVETVDLLSAPKFAEQYTTETVKPNGLIVVNKTQNRSKYIPYADMFITDTRFDTLTFAYETQTIALDMEGQINAALHFVANGKLLNLYAVIGHGETELGTEGQNTLRKANVNYNTLETMTASAIPEDCDILYIAAPTSDYTEQELAIIREYTAAGGDLLMMTNTQEGMSNLGALYADYGLKAETAIIIEGDSSAYVPGAPYYLYPQTGSHELLRNFYGKYVPIQYAYALTELENPEADLTISALLSSTSSSYLKTVSNGGIKTLEKEDGDPEGPFHVGVYVKNNDTNSEAVVFSSVTVFLDNALKTSSYANAELLTASVNYMAETEEIATVRTISLEEEDPLVITAAEALTIGLVFVIILPVLLLVIGVVVMILRRKK